MKYNRLSSIRVTRVNKTIFVPLPKESQTEIFGGCDCNHCKSHRDQPPMWDTLALCSEGNVDWTWIVHYPELQPSFCRCE